MLLIGHNPGLEGLALHLSNPKTSQDKDGVVRMQHKYPTCGLAALRFADAEWSALSSHSCRLDAFLTPNP